MRVLQKTGTLGSGGIQKFLVSTQAAINAKYIQFDYSLYSTQPQFFTSEALKYGGKIYGPTKNEGILPKRILNRYLLYFSLIRRNKYTVVHISEDLVRTGLSALVAKAAGAKVIIAHSHNDHHLERFSLFNRILNAASRLLIQWFATDYFTCSESAARWMFTPKIVNEKRYRLVRNGIDTSSYKFDFNQRNSIRKNLGIDDDALVLGHVGRFTLVKNHDFILETFSSLLKIRNDSYLVLVGEGELKKKMEDRATQLGIRERVIFFGESRNIPGILSAMDAFIFPSRYEGLGIAAVEAQASDLPTFCAYETIPHETKITDRCVYLKLSEGSAAWAARINQEATSHQIRRDVTQQIAQAGYDSKDVARSLEKFYNNCATK